jgi:hypothetical protein
MNTAASFLHSISHRQVGRALLGSIGLIAALAAYCELCSLVNGYAAPGLDVSVPWAVQVSLGWIVVGVVFGTLAPRLADSVIALTHPRVMIAASILAISAFTMSCEALLVGMTDDGERSLWALARTRGPISVAISAFLVALYIGDRLWKPGQPPPYSVTKPAARDSAGITPSAAHDSSSRSDIEVMTGTGRTTVRIEQVECLQAERNYINVVHSSGREYLLRQTMTTTERTLDPTRFIRIHRSTIVNRDFIKERRRDGVLVLSSGRTVKISRAYRDRLN